MQANPMLSLSRSFNAYESRRLTDIAARVVEEFKREWESNDDYFDCYTEESPPHHTSNAKVPDQQEQPQTQEDDEEDVDFEFSFVCSEPETSPISADEIFYNGQIRPIFPIFNTELLFDGDATQNEGVSKPQTTHRLSLRQLMTGERNPPSCSLSEAEIDGVPSGTYCVWTPKTRPNMTDL